MDSPQQIAQARFESVVAVRAAETPGGAEISEGRRAEGALGRFALDARHLLVNRLQEIVDLRLRRSDRRLDSPLGCALLAQMQLPHPAPLDLGELDYRLAILAQIANHLYDDLIYLGTTQLAPLEQQHLIRASSE